jgi:hypothetical protein
MHVESRSARPVVTSGTPRTTGQAAGSRAGASCELGCIVVRLVADQFDVGVKQLSCLVHVRIDQPRGRRRVENKPCMSFKQRKARHCADVGRITDASDSPLERSTRNPLRLIPIRIRKDVRGDLLDPERREYGRDFAFKPTSVSRISDIEDAMVRIWLDCRKRTPFLLRRAEQRLKVLSAWKQVLARVEIPAWI